MLKLVTCPELECPARLHTGASRRSGRAQVLYCSLWDNEEVIESCRETCVTAGDGRRRQRPS